MATEIERKFLTRNNDWKPQSSGTLYKQAYLSSTPERTVRVRIQGDQAYLTIKTKGNGISREEFEYSIPLDDAEQLLTICETAPLEKTRYHIMHQGKCWEVDEFHGNNQGLILAEIELSSEDESFAHPEWLGEEVSGDKRYYNSQLSINPFCEWP